MAKVPVFPIETGFFPAAPAARSPRKGASPSGNRKMIVRDLITNYPRKLLG
jgi:hypothetical protein